MSTSTTPTPTATATPAYTEAWLPGLDGTNFYTRKYAAAAPRAVVLFVHGFAEHVGRYEWAHGEYAARGVTVFTYDQRGFGRTALDRARKSKHSAYGKTSWHDQLGDIEHWVQHLKKEHPDLPLFLKGHSMGGGLALAFATRTTERPSRDTLSLLSGVIASSPLILQTFPVSRTLRYIGGKASAVLPALPVSAPVPLNDLSRNKEANEASARDPWVVQKGSLKGLHDMFSGGEQLIENDYKHWPNSLPLLIAHGTADRVTSFKAAEEFHNKVDAADKELKPFPAGFHELVHEPDGMKEQFVDECISWLLKRVAAGGDALAPSGGASKL